MTAKADSKPRSFRWQWHDAIWSKRGPPDITVRAVLEALCTFMGDKAECFPSHETLVECAGLSRKSIGIVLQKAQAWGWVRIENRGNGQGWRRYRYIALIPPVAEPTVPGAESEVSIEVPGDTTTVVGELVPADAWSEAERQALDQIRETYPLSMRSPEWDGKVERQISALVASAAATWGELIDGVERYAAQCKASYTVGTQFVLKPVNFFNAKERRWVKPYRLPLNKAEIRLALNIETSRDWLARFESGDGIQRPHEDGKTTGEGRVPDAPPDAEGCEASTPPQAVINGQGCEASSPPSGSEGGVTGDQRWSSSFPKVENLTAEGGEESTHDPIHEAIHEPTHEAYSAHSTPRSPQRSRRTPRPNPKAEPRAERLRKAALAMAAGLGAEYLQQHYGVTVAEVEQATKSTC